MRNAVTCPTEQSIGRQLRGWYDRPLGRQLASAEQVELDRILPDLFGYHLLQVGFAGHNLCSASRILHRVSMAVGHEPDEDQAVLSGDPALLPIASCSLDALILHHTLEFAGDPRQVLREVERTLVPEGHVVILGFNPRSCWGLWRLLRRRNAVPWCGRFFSPVRIKDWLNVLGFEVISSKTVFFRPPIQREGVAKRLQFMETLGARWWPFLGGAYVLVARKKVITLTPIKPRWRPRRSRVGLADPAARRLSDSEH